MCASRAQALFMSAVILVYSDVKHEKANGGMKTSSSPRLYFSISKVLPTIWRFAHMTVMIISFPC